MNYSKIDATLSAQIENIEKLNDRNNKISLFIDLGDGIVHTARLSLETIRELSDQKWIIALRGSSESSPLK